MPKPTHKTKNNTTVRKTTLYFLYKPSGEIGLGLGLGIGLGVVLGLRLGFRFRIRVSGLRFRFKV